MLLRLGILVFSFMTVGGLVYMIYPIVMQWLREREERQRSKVEGKLDDMFITVSSRRLMFINIAIPVILGWAAFFILGDIMIAAAAGLVGAILPLVAVKVMEKNRRRKLSVQIVDGIMVLSSSLKAGLSLMQAIESVVEEMPSPMKQEFELVIRENKMGVTLEDSLINLKNRARIDEFDLLVTAILVARDTGGDLTVTFSQLVFTIREKQKIAGRVKALCVQAKLQGIVMGILPIVFAVFVYNNRPDLFKFMVNDRLGNFLLMYAAVSEVIGIYFIRKFSKVDV